MAEPKLIYRCQQCGYISPKWMGKCPECQIWDSFSEEVAPGGARKLASKLASKLAKTLSAHPVSLDQIQSDGEVRLHTGMGEWDRVLGGGLTKGSLVLLAGDPGIGKSTLLLQALSMMTKAGPVLYVSGEESPQQLKSRAQRLGLCSRELLIFSETSLEAVLDEIEKNPPLVVAVDSIQTMYTRLLDVAPGSISQVRECASRLMRTGKESGVSIFVIGHVTKEGAIAGPRALEHLVDTVLYLEGDRTHTFRLLRAVKNRYGSTNEVGVFEMKESGLEEVPNPSPATSGRAPQGGLGFRCGLFRRGHSSNPGRTSSPGQFDRLDAAEAHQHGSRHKPALASACSVGKKTRVQLCAAGRVHKCCRRSAALRARCRPCDDHCADEQLSGQTASAGPRGLGRGGARR